MMPKDWYRSRTLWFNAVSLLIVVATALTNPALAVDPRVVTAAGLVLTVGNAVLRLVTSVPIAGTPAAGAAPILPVAALVLDTPPLAPPPASVPPA